MKQWVENAIFGLDIFCRATYYSCTLHFAKIPLDDVATISESKSSQLLALDDALKHLAMDYPRQSEVVELRFFGGLSVEETAEALAVSAPTIVRDWSFARAWLSTYIKGLSDGR